MRRVSLALGFVLAVTSPIIAEPDSPLELVRALRAAGLVDLAVQRLDELRVKPDKLTPAEVQILPLELARIRLEEASRESDESRRASLIGQAKGAFEVFLKNNQTHPMAAQANVEIARLLALQAKSRLSRANRLEGQARALEYARARPGFTEAITRYQGAIVNLDNRLKGLDEKDPLFADLSRSKAQAELDAAVLQYEFGQTFVGEDERSQRGNELDKAQKAFEKLTGKYSEKRIGFLARVWGLQTAHLNGDGKALEALDKFVSGNRPNRDAADALRLAAFFGIEHALEADTGKEGPAQRFIRAERAAENWLRTYPDARNTPEGLGARYRRALMKEQQAMIPGNVRYSDPPIAKKPQSAPVRKIIGISANAKGLLEDANKIYKELTETDNEYSERAQRHRLNNQLVILDGEGGKEGDPPLRSINTLEQGYLAAQIQLARIYKIGDSGLAADKHEAEEKRRIRLATDYLERGLRLATPKDTARDVFDARMLLVRFLTQNERAVEAAVLGEALARNNPKAPKAALAAQLAIYAYNTAVGKLKAAGGADEDAEVDIGHIRNLAAFAEANWPTDGPTDAVRHVLAFYQGNREPKDYEAAWTTYSRIGAGYSDVSQARREMAGAMFYLVRPDEKHPKKYQEAMRQNITKRAAQWRVTLSGLESLGEPPASANAHEAESWAGAKTMQAQLYYLAADYDKVDATVKQIGEAVKKFTALDEKKRDDLDYTARVLKYNALLGRALDFIRAKEFAKIGDTLGGELEALKAELKLAPPAEAPPGFDRMRRAQRDFLIASMSGFVQNKQPDKATELLEVLQSVGGSLESNVAVMRQLATSIRVQIDALTKEGKKGDADELARSFTEFLDKIRGEDTSKLPAGVVLFLGQGYGAVDQHARAAELYEQLLAQPFVNPGKTPPEQEEAATKDVTDRRQFNFYRAKALRQAGGKVNFDKATALMQEIVGEPIKKGGKQGWGYKNLDIRKEYIALLEDQKLFGPAGSNWTQLSREFGGGVAPPTQVKFLGQRAAILAVGQILDEATPIVLAFPTRIAATLDVAFKTVFPPLAARRNAQRVIYFDLYVEAQRCWARANTAFDPSKIKGGPDTINQRLTDVGQKLHDLLAKNDDVSAETKEKLKDLLDQYPQVKKKFDELSAAKPKS